MEAASAKLLDYYCRYFGSDTIQMMLVCQTLNNTAVSNFKSTEKPGHSFVFNGKTLTDVMLGTKSYVLYRIYSKKP